MTTSRGANDEHRNVWRIHASYWIRGAAMARLIIRMKWWLFGEPACVTRKRIREEMAQMGYESAWTNWYFQARGKE